MNVPGFYANVLEYGEMAGDCLEVLGSILAGFEEEEQRGIWKQLGAITLDLGTGPVDFGRETPTEYPYVSIWGTCGMEQFCGRDVCSICIAEIPCCQGCQVGHSEKSHIRKPVFWELLTGLVVWMALCPMVDAVCGVHDDCPPGDQRWAENCEYVFLLKNKMISHIRNRGEAERLCRTYSEKYPWGNE